MTFSPDLNGLLSLGKKEKVMFVSVEAGDRCGEEKKIQARSEIVLKTKRRVFPLDYEHFPQIKKLQFERGKPREGLAYRH